MKQMARWGALPLLAVPVGTWALGLGDIQLQSALDQPLRAQIRLSASKEELQGLDITLADPATFQRYGLDRPGFLSTLKFTVGKDSAGHDVIDVTSPEPINEPFVTMLIEATWPKGRSLREYTVLLDPPVFRKQETAPVREAQSAPAESAAPAASASSAGGAIARPQPAPAVSAAPPPAAPAPARATPAPAPAAAAATNVRLGGTYGPVHRAETLWSIASQVRPAGATMNQTMVALYQANQSAFEGNMNLLRAGTTLKIPTGADIGNVEARNATAEVQRQTAQWRNNGQGTGQAGAQASGQQQARLRLEPAGTGSANAGAAAAPAGASASGGESANANASAAGGGSATAAGTAGLRGQVDTLQSQLKESRRLLQLRDQQLSDLQQQLAAAKAGAGAAAKSATTAGATSAGAQLEPDKVFAEGQQNPQNNAAKGGQAAASTGNQAASATQPSQPPAQATAPSPAPAAKAPSAAAAAAAGPPEAAKKVVTTTSAPAPSLLSRLMSALATPIVLIGLGAGALLLTALWYLRRRRDEVEDVTGRWEALEAEAEAEDVDHATTARLRSQAEEKDFIVEESASVPERAPQPPPVERPVAQVTDTAATGKFEAPVGDAGQSSVSDETLSSQTVINLDQADPVAEADFHMAYGLYDQAAELVSQAIQKNPANRSLKLKLLEVFFVWGNKEAFLDAAKAFRAEVGDVADADWDKVIIMGKQLCPDEALFADATAGAAQVDVDLDAGDGDAQALDFAFDDGTDADAPAAADTHSGVDLDLGGGADDSLDLRLEATGDREAHVAAGGSSQAEADASAFTASNDALDIGAETSAGLEEALFGLDDDDTGRRTTPNVDSLAETQESPTVETPHSGFGADFSGITMESPTVEMDQPSDVASDAEAPTVETPTVESSALHSIDADAPTVETPTVETAYSGAADATVESSAMGEDSSPTELTAEIDLDDLGLDVKDLEGLPEDIGELPSADDGESDTREQPSIGADDEDELLSATGVTQVLGEADMDLEHVDTSVLGGADATMKAPSLDENTLTGTEVLEPAAGLGDAGKQTGSGLDLDLDDFNAALQGGDTVEQPTMQSFGGDVFKGNGQTPVDLDIGSDMSGSDDPTGTEDMGALDPQTMTEVGTKLDLARAYIDMGDPEGARSILEEVLDEGDAGQKREAQSLMEALTA